MSAAPISPADLHAYVDGELTETRHAEVARWLADHPDDAARVESYRSHKQGLRAQFDPVIDEPLPDRLLQAVSAPHAADTVAGPGRLSVARTLPTWSLQRIAATVLIALLAGAAGWLARDFQQPDSIAANTSALPHRAAIAHVVFSPDVKRPVEIGAAQEEQLTAWLSRRIGTAVRAPKLGKLGFELIGGRLLPGNNGPVAQFMYHDTSGQRLTLYISTENSTNRDTAFRFVQEGPVSVFYWIDGKFGYAISAGLPKAELARIATAVYDQFQP